MLRFVGMNARLLQKASSYSRAFSTSTNRPLLEKVLVANRGEIACRVIRTCKRLGIPTVAVYSIADGPNSLHAMMADEAFQVGHGSSPSESYLLQDEILDIARLTGSEAVHPGYGFLSENADFCSKIEGTSGLKFVGPPRSAIEAMGSKSKSKEIMDLAGVPTTPGYYDKTNAKNQDPMKLLEEAGNIGYPLLIKAVMGGGGKGMRIVERESDFLESLKSCQSEARKSFSDDRVLLEKYLVEPRHVEVQVLADSHGNAVHLFERDCSLQRRHQKIIEEAPASDLSDELRYQFGSMATKAAQAVGYENAGTVEFLLDTRSTSGDFYFCEMNTRLQVEHPITECITGVDLVEWQLRVAAGQEVPNQNDITCTGHAFEARIYAENPAKNFLPAAGTVLYHHTPADPNSGMNADGVRVDTGVQVGQQVGVDYDPMISKLIVHGKDRSSALDRLVGALKGYHITGVPTNIDFLINCAKHPVFATAGATNTGFLDHYLDQVQVDESLTSPPIAKALGAWAVLLLVENRFGVVDLDSHRKNVSPWDYRVGSWRQGYKPIGTLMFPGGGSVRYTCYRDGSFLMQLMDSDNDEIEKFHISGSVDTSGTMNAVLDNCKRVTSKMHIADQDGVFRISFWPEQGGDKDATQWSIAIENPLILKPVSATTLLSASEGTIKSPMPGKISRVYCAVGDEVEEGKVLLVMEAMKMEHAIKAPRAGVLKAIMFHENDIVNDGVVLAVVEPGENDVDDARTASA